METVTTPQKVALCIRFIDAPADVRRAASVTGTHLLALTEEFFRTGVTLEDRALCETNPELLQLLPYIVIMERGTGRVFRYFRGKGGNEDRLHGKISIGVGGHVEDYPGNIKFPVGTMYHSNDLFAHLKEDAERECVEEIGVAPDKIDFMRLMYNNAGVNQVHLGILGLAVVDSVAALEAGVIENGEFVDPHDLLEAEVFERMEDWSKAALTYVINHHRSAAYFG